MCLHVWVECGATLLYAVSVELTLQYTRGADRGAKGTGIPGPERERGPEVGSQYIISIGLGGPFR